MNLDETAALFVVIQGFDHRTCGETELFAWQAVLHDVDFVDAREAVMAHYAECKDWIMPADVRAGAKRAALHRASRTKAPAITDDGDGPVRPLTEEERERFWNQAAAHGITPQKIGRPAPMAGQTRKADR